MMLPDWLLRCAENYPQRLALSYKEVQWSFAELDSQVRRVARQLATLDIHEGSRVALLAANGLHYVVFVHALTRLGAILVPLNVRLTQDELCWQLNDVRATLLVSDADHAAVANEIGHAIPRLTQVVFVEDAQQGVVALQGLHENAVALRELIDLDATQAILYTSGTTGRPKGALITYGMQWWNALGSALNLGHRPDDRWLAVLPFFHIGGLSILMRSVIYGIGVIVQKRFDAEMVNQAIREEQVTIISVVAVMLQRMLSAPDTSYPETLRCVLLGGGPAPHVLLETCEERGIPVVQTYGLTESCSQAVSLAPEDALRKLGSAGRPLASVQLRIMYHKRQAVGGEAGEIMLKGPTITPGYADRQEETAAAFSDGWFATGDIGYLDEEGYLYVLDRRNDLIISGGENVYPAEVEAVLMAHPDVEEAGVRGQEDAQWGQVPVAFVRLRTGSTVGTEELLNYAAQHLARYKQPRAIAITGPLPRNAAGKLLRRELPRI